MGQLVGIGMGPSTCSLKTRYFFFAPELKPKKYSYSLILFRFDVWKYSKGSCSSAHIIPSLEVLVVSILVPRYSKLAINPSLHASGIEILKGCQIHIKSLLQKMIVKVPSTSFWLSKQRNIIIYNESLIDVNTITMILEIK